MTTLDDQAFQVGVMLENQSRGAVPNSDNSSAKNKGNEGEAALVNNKRKGTTVITTTDNTTVPNAEEAKSEHQLHIWTERERRKKMRNMFSTLQALLPNVSSKADKTTIVNEAVIYIQKQQQTLEKLEKEKQDRLQCVSPLACESSVTSSQWQPYDSNHGSSSNSNFSNVVEPSKVPLAFQTVTSPIISPNVALNFCGDIAQFCICSTKKQSLMTTIAFVLEKYKIDVISASILRNDGRNIYMIQAHANRASQQFQDSISVEQIYIKAAEEISLWTNAV